MFGLREARQKKGLTVRQVALMINADAALVSKFESGGRMPTRDQLLKLSEILTLDANEILTEWLKEKILAIAGEDELGIEALRRALKARDADYSGRDLADIDDLLADLDALKARIKKR